MRVLLDSNVWLSILTARQVFCRRLWRCLVERCEVFAGQPIVREVEEKLVKKFRHSASRAHRLAMFVQRRTTEIVLTAQPSSLCRDPDDDVILALAVLAQCEYLISGDRDLLVLGSLGEMRIVSPREVASILGMS